MYFSFFVYVAFSFGFIFFYIHRRVIGTLARQITTFGRDFRFLFYHHPFPKLISARMNWIVSSRIIVWSKIHVFMYVFIHVLVKI